MKMSLKAVLIIVISIGFVAAAIDYCDIQTRFCKGKPHVACNMTKVSAEYIIHSFATNCMNYSLSLSNVQAASVPTCQNQKRISFNDAQQQKFIKRINNYRNEFAAGRVNNFKPASRMATTVLTWIFEVHYKVSEYSLLNFIQQVYDPELAYLAYHNLEECGYNYDKCRATGNISSSKKNVIIRSWNKTFLSQS